MEEAQAKPVDTPLHMVESKKIPKPRATPVLTFIHVAQASDPPDHNPGSPVVTAATARTSMTVRFVGPDDVAARIGLPKGVRGIIKAV